MTHGKKKKSDNLYKKEPKINYYFLGSRYFKLT